MKKIYIFSSKTCPNCPAAEMLGEKLKADHQVVFRDIGTVDGLSESIACDVHTVPAILILDNQKEIKRWTKPPKLHEIKKWMKNEIDKDN